jgi:hypothetical protein
MVLKDQLALAAEEMSKLSRKNGFWEHAHITLPDHDPPIKTRDEIADMLDTIEEMP